MLNRLAAGLVFAASALSLLWLPRAGAEPAPESCGGVRFRFTLQDVDGRTYQDIDSVSRAPVVMAYYSGYKSHKIHDALREAMRRDPLVGKGGPLDAQWSGFAIIDYKEGWFVPAWAMDRALRDQMRKHPKATILADRGECLSREGTSDKCPAAVRRAYFKSGEGSLLVTYRGYIVQRAAGPGPVGPLVRLMQSLSASAAKGLGYCAARQAALASAS